MQGSATIAPGCLDPHQAYMIKNCTASPREVARIEAFPSHTAFTLAPFGGSYHEGTQGRDSAMSMDAVRDAHLDDPETRD